MKHLLSIIILAGALSLVTCDDASSERNENCIDKLGEKLELIMVLCSNSDYWSARGYSDPADCRNFEGKVALLTYFECKSEDATN